MSCRWCEGSERNLERIKFAPAALFFDAPFVLDTLLDCKAYAFLSELVEKRKFVLSVNGTFSVFDYCPACGQKFNYMKWIRELWDEFGDLPMNPETEEIETEWLWFRIGTHREDIWHWFEKSFGVSVAEDLMYCSS